MHEANLDCGQLNELDRINVMVVGGGGRENALMWKLAQSERIGNLILAPDSTYLLKIAQELGSSIDLAIIGPDGALAGGVVDEFNSMGIPAFGPNIRAAQIESSKPYAKRMMDQNKVPTAEFSIFDNPLLAHNFIDGGKGLVYVKAGGLAAGKGAVECATIEEAHIAIDDIMVRRSFGETAGKEIVIEEFLTGDEISLHAICDGEEYRMFSSAQDHKKIGEGGTGTNTGGMGTISPVPWFDQRQVEEAGLNVVGPILSAMHREGNDFRGMLFPGIMVKNGVARVLEYNARFGDPETQVYVRRLESDLLELVVASLTHNLDKARIDWSDNSAVCIVAAAGGYPNPQYEIGKRITGIDEANNIDGVEVFMAGVRIEADGDYHTTGGRVLGVTAVGKTLDLALDLGYDAMDRIHFDGMQLRRDIGLKSLDHSL